MTFEEIHAICSPYTITSYERMKKLYEAVLVINGSGIDGDYVECGVFKGGSVMLMACTQLNYEKKVHIHLYDTFEGMTPPIEIDRDYNGTSAAELLKSEHYTCRCAVEEVMLNMKKTDYPESYVHYHRGDVCLTLRESIPEKISLLRLDTDWYESTKMELEKLYPKLVPGGILIVDDYGHFEGSRKATDDFFKTIKLSPNFERIDYTGVLHVKRPVDLSI